MSLKIGSIQPLGPIFPGYLDEGDHRIGVYLASDHGVPVVELTAGPCVLSVSDAECLVQLLNLAIGRARDPSPRRAYEPPKLEPLIPGDPRARRLAEAILRGQGRSLPGSGGDEPPVSAPSAPSDTEPAPAPEPDPFPSEATAPLPPSPGSEATPPRPPLPTRALLVFHEVCGTCRMISDTHRAHCEVAHPNMPTADPRRWGL